MPRIQVLTLFPQMIEEGVRHGLLGQALQKNLLRVETLNPRDFATDRHRSVDDRPFGGGDGMVLSPEVLTAALQTRAPGARVVYLSPQGKPLDSAKARELSGCAELVLVCGRYGGIDQRIIRHAIDEEISIGDYVLSGGEVAALVVIEALSRFVPGVLGHDESAEKDSFTEGLLEAPAFTKPREFAGESVPEILLSGNHARIEEWRRQISLLVTLKKRPDLFSRYVRLHPSQGPKAWLPKLRHFYENLPDDERRVLGLENLSWEGIHDG